MIRACLPALAIGAVGFAGNMLELQLGWGMHFIFGNALVYAFVRVLQPAAFVAAASVASAWTILLWNHPWAWGIWTMEAALVALLVRRTSPIRADLGFWLLLGTPLLTASYGGIMGMDDLSLSLTIVKQAINGILNAALGEVLYTLGLVLLVRGRPRSITKLPIEAFVLMLMVTTILIPTVIYLGIDADNREQIARGNAARILDDELHLAAEALVLWQEARAQTLRNQPSIASSGDPDPIPDPANWHNEFLSIEVEPARATRQSATRIPAGNSPPTQFIMVPAPQLGAAPILALATPGSTGAAPLRIVGALRDRTIPNLVARLPLGDTTIYLRTPDGANILLKQNGNSDFHVAGLFEPDIARALDEPVLLSRTSYGNALMTDLKDATILRATALRNQPDWQLVGMIGLNAIVLAERRAQLDLFLTLAGLLTLVIIVGSMLATRIRLALRTLAQSAADLAMSGANRKTIDGLVIRELSDLSISLASVGSTVAQERGALFTYQRRLHSIARHAPVMVYTLDSPNRRRARLNYISETIIKLLGFTHEEASQPAWWRSVVHPDDYPRCLEAFDALRLGQAISHEYRLRHKRGHYVWVFDTLALEADPSAGRAEAVGLILDISDRRRAVEQLIQADKMASLGRMVAGVAHELNQPLNFIKLAAANLKERSKRGLFEFERFLIKLEGIIAQTDRAAAIILQMRVFGRTSAEAAGPMQLQSACENLHILIGSQLEAEGIVLDTSGCDPNLELYALPVLIEQVLLNLLLNARDAILSERGDGQGQSGRISIEARRQNQRAIITVSDNGPGIPEHIMPALFEPFFTTKPPREGTGLGLSISYGIIRDLGGTIEAANTPNGALFTINLPCIAEAT